MLETNKINTIRNLHEQGLRILEREPTPQMCREFISEAKKKSVGTGLMDTVVETAATDIGSEIGANVARALGFKVRGGRKAGSKAGSNMARNARYARIRDAEASARNVFQQRRTRWEAEARDWLQMTMAALDSVHSRYSSSYHQKKTMNVQLSTRMHNVSKLSTKLRRADDILNHILNCPDQYISAEEWNALEAAKNVETTILIKKGESGKAYAQLQDIINRAQKYIDWQDPYVCIENLILLKASRQVSRIRLLIGQTPSSEFQALLNELRYKKINIEVRHFGPDRNTVPFHDRFLLTDLENWQIGTSANGLGLRDSAINRIDNPSNIKQRFEELWTMAKVLI